jgi:phage shock protein A
MGIFSRIADIFTANLNALLDRAENPEVMLDHMIREMEDGLARARRCAAVAVAAESRLRRDRDDNRGRGELWQARARQALAAGREDLARWALARKHEHDDLGRELEENHAEAAQAGQSARTAVQALEARLAEAHRKQRSLLARHRAAQVRVEVQRQLGSGRTDFAAAQARFEKMAERWNQLVEELAAEAALSDPPAWEAECIDLERRLAVDRELDAMKHDARSEPEA